MSKQAECRVSRPLQQPYIVLVEESTDERVLRLLELKRRAVAGDPLFIHLAAPTEACPVLPPCSCDVCDVYGQGTCEVDDPDFDPESI